MEKKPKKKKSVKESQGKFIIPMPLGLTTDEFFDNRIITLFKLSQGDSLVIHTKGSDDSIAHLIFKHMRGSDSVRKHIFNALKLYEDSLGVNDDTVLYLQGLS